MTGVAVASLSAAGAEAQVPATGPEMYRAWCQQCHGVDGSGRTDQRTVATVPLDFTDCRVASPEPDADWSLAIRAGGPAVGLSADMPSFDTLSAEQVRRLVAHLRSFCREPGWPHGNLNLPRALFARKAFPENELLIRPMVSHSARTYTMTSVNVAVEKRLWRRAHVEIEVPLHSVEQQVGRVMGVGDVALGAKYVLFASDTLPLIVSAGGSLSLPTGDRAFGFGEGTRVLEPYLAAATMVGRLYLQADLGAHVYLPRVESDPIRHLIFNAAISIDLRDSPATWSLGLGLDGTAGGLGLVPEIRKGLTRSGTFSAAAGFRIPLRPPFPYAYDSYRWTGYLLWEPVPRPTTR